MIRVLIVDDHPVVRSGIRGIVDSSEDIVVVAELDDGADAVETATRHAPDIVLMDLQMPIPGTTTITALRQAEAPGRIIALTTYDDEDQVLRAIRAGAVGYLLKDTPPDDLLDAIRRVHAGEGSLDGRVATALTRTMQRPDDGRLSERETRVIRAVADGRSNREIAADLFISETTVKSHLSTIATKLGTRDRASSVATAIRQGLI